MELSTESRESSDPLVLLPAEIVLRILEFSPISSVAKLTSVSKDWHEFIDFTHQDAIYSSPEKTPHPAGVRDFSYLQDDDSFVNYFDGVSSWKEVCRRNVLLRQNWNAERPVTKESIVQIGNDPVWRFRPDFKRRIFISTSQAGGFRVTDMDSGDLIWHLSSDDVRSFAHLEYQDGTAVWDREGNALEVWKADLEGAERGEFRQVAILPHDWVTRGFQLSYNTLCVVSTEGQAYVYDLSTDQPSLSVQFEIEDGAIGHLDQDEENVMFSFGDGAYHIYQKSPEAHQGRESGKQTGFIAQLDPKQCVKHFHIKHPDVQESSLQTEGHGPTTKAFPPANAKTTRCTPLTVEPGHIPLEDEQDRTVLEQDEWGAGMLRDDLMVGISRAGRVFVVPKYRDVLAKRTTVAQSSFIIECESDGGNFDLGGWLSLKDNRMIFEIQGRIYMVALDENGEVYTSTPTRASYAITTASAPQLMVPVSFMALYDDCIMTTYTTLGWRQAQPLNENEEPEVHGRIFPTKTIRILSLAPELKANRTSQLWHRDDLSSENKSVSQLQLLQLVSMLGAEIDEDESGLDVFEGVMGLADEDEDGDEESLEFPLHYEHEEMVEGDDSDAGEQSSFHHFSSDV